MTTFPTPDDVARLRVEALAAAVRDSLVARFRGAGEVVIHLTNSPPYSHVPELPFIAAAAAHDEGVVNAVADHFRAAGWMVTVEHVEHPVAAHFLMRLGRAAVGT